MDIRNFQHLYNLYILGNNQQDITLFFKNITKRNDVFHARYLEFNKDLSYKEFKILLITRLTYEEYFSMYDIFIEKPKPKTLQHNDLLREKRTKKLIDLL